MKPMNGKVTFAGGFWTVRTANGIEIGSCPGEPRFASALAAVALSAEGSIVVRPEGDREEYEWTVTPVVSRQSTEIDWYDVGYAIREGASRD